MTRLCFAAESGVGTISYAAPCCCTTVSASAFCPVRPTASMRKLPVRLQDVGRVALRSTRDVQRLHLRRIVSGLRYTLESFDSVVGHASGQKVAEEDQHHLAALRRERRALPSSVSQREVTAAVENRKTLGDSRSRWTAAPEPRRCTRRPPGVATCRMNRTASHRMPFRLADGRLDRQRSGRCRR